MAEDNSLRSGTITGYVAELMSFLMMYESGRGTTASDLVK